MSAYARTVALLLRAGYDQPQAVRLARRVKRRPTPEAAIRNRV